MILYENIQRAALDTLGQGMKAGSAEHARVEATFAEAFYKFLLMPYGVEPLGFSIEGGTYNVNLNPSDKTKLLMSMRLIKSPGGEAHALRCAFNAFVIALRVMPSVAGNEEK
jgi:hypothetical protein